MKRLRTFLLSMKPTSETYEEVYEGKLYETFIDKDPIIHNQAIYWDGEIGYEITKSNRLELSKPTVTIHIPLKLLRMEETNVAALDYVFRSFIPYIRTLNDANDNRKRPAKENGHYDIYEPNHKILKRNVISAKMVSQKYYRILSGSTIETLDGAEAVPAYLCVGIMIQVQLPEGKHKKAAQMLTRDLPEAVNLFIEEFDRDGLRRTLQLYEKQEEIRTWLKENGYCAFVANGSILPREKGGNPSDFSTEHASGSISQAANIMEAVGWGVNLLLIDEDKSATNFMIQDAVMKTLIEKEPITPFVERVQELAKKVGVSTILVIGGSSEYLRVADRIYMMRDYQIEEVTQEAKQLQADCVMSDKMGFVQPEPADYTNPDEVDANLLTTYPEESATEVLKVSELGFLIFGEEQVDVRMLHDIATIPQLTGIAFLLRKLIGKVNPLSRFQKFTLGGAKTPKWICREKEVELLLREIEEEGLETAYSPFFTECGRWMDLPRKQEILAVLSRMRTGNGEAT